ncbi:MAG: signal peptidase I [Bacteroidia bacterium]|nr:signal peptidase I [Bacteroidia bacterium]
MFREFLKNKWFKFSLISILYLLWVIWMRNYWLLLGLGIIFDLYITRKVHWAFWKKRNVEKQTKVVEWVDALIFAVIAATFIRMFFIEAYTIPTSSMEKTLLVGDYLFVSKFSYGPKLPNTPLSFPFAHNTLPLTKDTRSYLEWIKWPYKRLAGLEKIRNDDVVVFNFPEGDTVATKVGDHSYYGFVRMFGRDRVWNDKDNFGEIITRPVDKRENYIKRCVAIPGDTIHIVNSDLFINGKHQKFIENLQYNYTIVTDGNMINSKFLDRMNIAMDDREFSNGQYILPLTPLKAEEIKKFSNVVSVTKSCQPAGVADNRIFPHSPYYKWNEDNFGPLVVPKKGTSVKLTVNNLPVYERIIGVYEHNDLQVKNGKIFINGAEAVSYTFKMDYYWMMGDNRHMSADSRFWGFVPEDHVVGKAVFVWLSLDKDKSLFGGKIRFDRMFRTVH